MVGKIIALKPLVNMTKMPDFGVNSFLRSHEAEIFVNLAEMPRVQRVNDKTHISDLFYVMKHHVK